MNKNNLLIILDGFGLSNEKKSSAYLNAKAPTLNSLLSGKNFPLTKLDASGEMVGLPKGQMGNSEVGHLNIGGGRIVYQDILRINNDIKSGDFFSNKNLLSLIEKTKKNRVPLHLIGLVSDGGVHSSMKHLFSILALCKKNHLKNVFIHAILDGRDTPPKSALKYLKAVDAETKRLKVGEIVSISGRFYALDRDKNWDRVKKYYDLLTVDSDDKLSTLNTYEKELKAAYKRGETDEFVTPKRLVGRFNERVDKSISKKEKHSEKFSAFTSIKDRDSILFFNFRADRARELTRVFMDKKFKEFKREVVLKNLNFYSLTRYDDSFKDLNVKEIYPPLKIKNTLGEFVSKNGLKQLRLAETEKYAHVTFFFNGGVETPYKNEERILIPSPKVKTYDLKPEMSAYKITDTLIANIKKNKFDLIIVNFANPDMVGHTGNFKAGIKAVEAVDNCLKKILDAFGLCISEEYSAEKKSAADKIKKDYNILITADHGNIEDMINSDGSKKTAHSTNKVPLVLISSNNKLDIKGCKKLADIAPLILKILGLKVPSEMKAR